MTDLLKRLEAVESRLAVLEDQERIRRCLARYGYNADLGRSEEWVDVWAEDGLYDLGYDRHEGKAALREMITSPTHQHKVEIENRSFHSVFNLFIEIEGQTAWAEGYSIVFVRRPEGISPVTAGYNHWDFVRDGDGWLLTRRLRRKLAGDEWGGETIKSYLSVPA